MMNLTLGRYRTRLAETAEDLAAAQGLRGQVFLGQGKQDTDRFDAACRHVLVEDHVSGALVCCFRFMALAHGVEINRSYSAQYYELGALKGFDAPIVELGRFCVDPDHRDPDILRIALGAMTEYVDAHQVGLLFGCASFPGTDAARHGEALSLLSMRHLAPGRWAPREKAPDIVRFGAEPPRAVDLRQAMLSMPPLLRTYLVMGGWVSDHAVVDTQMNTLHVFTGVEVAAIPPSRKKLLRAVVENAAGYAHLT